MTADELLQYTLRSVKWQCVSGGLGTHRNGLYRSDSFRYGKEHSHLISTQFKVNMLQPTFQCVLAAMGWRCTTCAALQPSD